MESDTYQRAFRAITWHITQFCMSNRYVQGESAKGSIHAFNPTILSTSAEIGDLVIPTSTPISEWWICWLEDIEQCPVNGKIFVEKY